MKSNMKTKTINMEGRYMSTYSFVGKHELEDVANEVLGLGWEADDDVWQIQEILDAMNPNQYHVSLIPDCKYEDDILVTLEETEELTIEKAKQFLRDNGYYMDTLWHIDDVKTKYKCDDYEAEDVLDSALNNDATMEQIWFAIEFHADDQGLKERKDEE